MNKMNKKGFSLVELIIVIAIMVILVAVIAPQYLKYVNNSKVSVDVQTAAELATLVDTCVADDYAPFGTGSSFTIASGSSKTFSATGRSSVSTGNVVCKYNSGYSFVVNGDNITGVSSITINSKEAYPNPDSSNGYNKTYKK